MLVWVKIFSFIFSEIEMDIFKIVLVWLKFERSLLLFLCSFFFIVVFYEILNNIRVIIIQCVLFLGIVKDFEEVYGKVYELVKKELFLIYFIRFGLVFNFLVFYYEIKD